MSVTGEIQTEIGTGSFWEVGQYKRTLRRIDDGNRLCNDLMNLIHERGEIEKAYAKNLRQWSKKWHDLIGKGPEYGTTEAAWKSVLNEADRVASLHVQVRDSLMNEVYTEVKSWQKDSYHKPMVGPLKEYKDKDDGFKKAQKPWAKKLDKVIKCKKDFHTACKSEKTAKNQENNAKGDSALSEDQRKKLEDKVKKLGNDVVATRDRYEASLQDINSYNPKYMEDMTEVFHQCQEMERKRLDFFKQTLFSVHKCLDLSVSPEFPEIYTEFHQTIENADCNKDLKWWSNTHGVDMAMNWPTLEEYSPELGTISKKQSKNKNATADGIMLTGIVHQRGDSGISNSSEPPQNYDTQLSSDSTHVQQPQPVVQSTVATTVAPTNSMDSTPADNNRDSIANPFGDDWDEDTDGALVDDGSPGVSVRALYDYDGAEDDELTFKSGDVFDKLEDEDEQGWCKGRKDGRVGLYPANYCEAIG